jgi:hypothetical protein
VSGNPALDEWLREVATVLGLPDDFVLDQTLLLDLTRVVAHGVARPAAPLSAFLVGFAAGRGAGQSDVPALVDRVISTIPESDG